MHRCAMCGFEFDPTGLVCHAACPLGAHCAVICCPHCGYASVDPGRATSVRWLSRLFGHRTAPEAPEPDAAPPGVPLLSLALGTEAAVVAVGAGLPAARQALSEYGLAPGARVRLRQRRPEPIVQVGETEIALERRVARTIYVAPPEDERGAA